jgi:hypothetical protein
MRSRISPVREVPEKDSVRSAEPFGYVDGISQPIIRGLATTSRQTSGTRPAAGRFILGYRDNQDMSADADGAARHDFTIWLPVRPADGRLAAGNGSATPHEARHDVGRNGTFLVVRQLER